MTTHPTGPAGPGPEGDSGTGPRLGRSLLIGLLWLIVIVGLAWAHAAP